MNNLESALAGIEQRINSPRAYPGWALDAERLLKALRHEMETSEELRTDSLPWVMRYDCTRSEYLEKRREELAAILANGREGR